MPEFILKGKDDAVYRIQAPDEEMASSMLEHGAIAKQDDGTFALPDAPLSVLEKFGTGAADPMYGTQQLYAHVAQSPERAAALDKTVAEREAKLKERGMEEGSWWRAAGRMIPAGVAGALTGGMGLGTGVLGAIGGGAASEMVNPTEVDPNKEDFWEKKTNQGLMGAATGGAGGAIIKGAGSMLGATLRPDARTLIDAGIDLTIPRMLGGLPSHLEDTVKRWPLLGHFIKGAEGRTLNSYNTSTINQMLEPLGQALPKGMPAGYAAIDYATQAAHRTYDSILRSNPNWVLTPNLGPKLFQDIAGTAQLAASSLPPSGVGQHFTTILRDHVIRNLAPLRQGQSMPVAAVDSIDGQLRHFVTTYGKSPNPAEREMARFLDDIRGSIRDTLMVSNPQQAVALRNADYAYAMLTRIQGAANQRRTSGGIFTPADMLASVYKQDPSVRQNAYSRGNALMQLFANTAQQVIPSGLHESNATANIAWRALAPLIAGAGTAGHAAPGLTGASLLALTAAGAPYTSPAMTATNWLMRNPAAWRTAMGRPLREMAGVAGSASEPLLANLASEPDYAPKNKAAPRFDWPSPPAPR